MTIKTAHNHFQVVKRPSEMGKITSCDPASITPSTPTQPHPAPPPPDRHPLGENHKTHLTEPSEDVQGVARCRSPRLLYAGERAFRLRCKGSTPPPPPPTRCRSPGTAKERKDRKNGITHSGASFAYCASKAFNGEARVPSPWIDRAEVRQSGSEQGILGPVTGGKHYK